MLNREQVIAAEDVLHDPGAISMIGSDAQAMGRIGEVIHRTWQTAHAMKRRQGSLPGDGAADNQRARRYVAKCTINPALTHGIDHLVGSVEVGKPADLVLREPKFFGVEPHLVLKGGSTAQAAMGDAHAPIPTPQPVAPARCSEPLSKPRPPTARTSWRRRPSRRTCRPGSGCPGGARRWATRGR